MQGIRCWPKPIHIHVCLCSFLPYFPVFECTCYIFRERHRAFATLLLIINAMHPDSKSKTWIPVVLSVMEHVGDWLHRCDSYRLDNKSMKSTVIPPPLPNLHIYCNAVVYMTSPRMWFFWICRRFPTLLLFFRFSIQAFLIRQSLCNFCFSLKDLAVSNNVEVECM